MKVYHGTTLKNAQAIAKNGISVLAGRINTDFGQGFYVTKDERYAINTAKKRARHEKELGAIIEAEYSIKEDLEILSFEKECVKWLQFIINNRNGLEYIKAIKSDFHNLDKRYDIVSGPIADQNISDFSRNLLENPRKITYNDVRKISYNYKTSQINTIYLLRL